VPRAAVTSGSSGRPWATRGAHAREGRHDPCILPRAVPVVEAMAALVVADLWLRSLAQPHRDWPLFSLGALAVIVGCVAFLFTLGWLSGDLGRRLAQLWPLLLIVLGLAALLQAILGRPRPKN